MLPLLPLPLTVLLLQQLVMAVVSLLLLRPLLLLLLLVVHTRLAHLLLAVRVPRFLPRFHMLLPLPPCLLADPRQRRERPLQCLVFESRTAAPVPATCLLRRLLRHPLHVLQHRIVTVARAAERCRRPTQRGGCG